jgi:hypothetical protein
MPVAPVDIAQEAIKMGARCVDCWESDFGTPTKSLRSVVAGEDGLRLKAVVAKCDLAPPNRSLNLASYWDATRHSWMLKSFRIEIAGTSSEVIMATLNK